MNLAITGTVRAVAAHKQNGAGPLGITILMLIIVLGSWMLMWLISRWDIKAADKGWILSPGAMGADPEEYRRSSERVLALQKRYAQWWLRTWPVAGVAAIVLVILITIALL